MTDTNGKISQIKDTLEAVQKLLETNQKDYTDAKFQQLKDTFEQLKNEVITEIEHNENLQDQKEKFSANEFLQLREKVEQYSREFDKRIEKLESTTCTEEKIENIIIKTGWKKWAERGVIIAVVITLIASGIVAYFNFNADVKTQLSHIDKIEKKVDKNTTLIEEVEDDLDDHEERDLRRDSELRIDMSTIKRYLKIK